VPFALSPDGRQIVYVTDDADGTKRLWLRALYSGHEQLLPGTEGANTPFWSPDSQWIGFFADNSLKKIRVSSGLTQVVASNVVTYGGAAWNAAGEIVFPAATGGLSRISAQGGPASASRKAKGAIFGRSSWQTASTSFTQRQLRRASTSDPSEAKRRGP
jgi:serine/threonine-protein kinase